MELSFKISTSKGFDFHTFVKVALSQSFTILIKFSKKGAKSLSYQCLNEHGIGGVT